MNDLKAIHNQLHLPSLGKIVVPDEDNERFESNSQHIYK